MKRVLSLLLTLAAPALFAQTGALPPSQQELVENINILKGRVDDLSDSRNALQKQVRDLQSKIDELSAKLAKPPVNYATEDDLKALKSAIEEVDRKRQADSENVVKTLNELAKSIKAPTPTPASRGNSHADITPTPTPAATVPDGPGFTYVAKLNDNLKKIAVEFNKTHPDSKTSVEEILKANPSLKGDPKNLKEGQKLFIPSAKGTESANN